MDKPVFALDVDGVVLDIVPGAISYVKRRYGADITVEDITDWDWDYALSLPEGLTPEFWKEVWDTPGVAYEGAVEFIEDLKETYKVVAISTRPAMWPGLGDAAQVAAHRDFAQFPFDEVELVNSSKLKPGVMKEHGASYIVEDNPKNAAHCGHEAGARAFLMTRPWNDRCSTVTQAWERVEDYADVLNSLRGY